MFSPRGSKYSGYIKTRMEALRSSLQRTDRILSGLSDVSLVFDYSSDSIFPAVSQNRKIEISMDKVTDLDTDKGLVHILGLNYHELAHVMYSVNAAEVKKQLPRSKPARPNFQVAYNYLEEHRIETLLAAKYSKVKVYFTYPVMVHLIQDATQWDTAFLLLHGRRFIPRSIRDTFRKRFEDIHGPDKTKRLAGIIDEYRILSLDRDIKKASNLVHEFSALMDELGIASKTNDCSFSPDLSLSPTPLDLKTLSDIASDSKKEEEKEDRGGDASKEGGESDEEAAGGGSASDSDDGSDNQDDQGERPEETGEGFPEEEVGGDGREDREDGDDPGSGPAETGESGSGDGQDDASDGEGGSDVSGLDAENGDGGSHNDVENPSGTQGHRRDDLSHAIGLGQLDSAMDEALVDVLMNQNVQTDIDDLVRAMDDPIAGMGSVLPEISSRDQPVTAKMVEESEKIAEEIRRVWSLMEPGWEWGQSEGRLNMNRAALASTPEDYDSLYDEWDEGRQEGSGMSIVVAVDASSSMETAQKMLHASQAVWSIRKALQEADSEVTVLCFTNECYSLFDVGDPVSTASYKYVYPNGGTDPFLVIQEASRIFSATGMQHKLFVAVTDGQWINRHNCRAELRKLDAVKVAMLIGSFDFDLANEFDVTSNFSTVSLIAPAMGQSAVKILERNTNQ